jgi:hypothetical protein
VTLWRNIGRTGCWPGHLSQQNWLTTCRRSINAIYHALHYSENPDFTHKLYLCVSPSNNTANKHRLNLKLEKEQKFRFDILLMRLIARTCCQSQQIKEKMFGACNFLIKYSYLCKFWSLWTLLCSCTILQRMSPVSFVFVTNTHTHTQGVWALSVSLWW